MSGRPKRRLMPRWSGAWGVALLVATVVGCKQPESTKLDHEPTSRVRSATVQMVAPRPVSRHLVLVEPARRSRLAPRIGGQLIELFKTEQDEVVAGEVLAKLAAQDSRGSLIAAKASIQRIDESIRDNRGELKTARTLAAKGIESARAVERLETTDAGLKAQLREAKGQLMRARDAVGAGTIEAPFDGTITKIETEVGEYLAPSSAAIVLVQLDPLALEVPLTEREVAMHDNGGLEFAVQIRGKRYPARLEWIAREADAGSSTFPARLLVDNHEHALRAGESAEVEVYGPANDAQTAVPMTAIRWAADNAYILVLRDRTPSDADETEHADANATLHRIDVVVGGDSDDLVAVQGAVSEGDRVVSAGPTRLIDGDAVIVVADPEPTVAAR